VELSYKALFNFSVCIVQYVLLRTYAPEWELCRFLRIARNVEFSRNQNKFCKVLKNIFRAKVP
jgi:hypothetical protein